MEEIALSDSRGEFELGNRYLADRGPVYLTGVQAIVRGLLDQRRADDAAGLRTGGFVSGYPGSPLGGVDRELARQRVLLAEHGIEHLPGLNEELAATSVWGSQLIAATAGARVDGVAGAWYGKAPGVDRAGDALRHANYSGTSPSGGAVAFVGEDPSARSSTLPSSAAASLAALCIPTFAPSDLQELLDFTLHAFACSRASGTWSAIRIRSDLADGAGSATVGPERLTLRRPLGEDGAEYRHTPSANLNHVVMADLERSLFSVRLPLASAYGALNGINRVRSPVPGAWLGIAADGQSYLEAVAALEDLGLDEETCEGVGIRLLKVGMPYPLEAGVVHEFATGLETVLVVESKLPFVELAVRDALYDVSSAPRVIGKRGLDGSPLLAATGELLRDEIARALATVLAGRVSLASIEAHLSRLDRAEPAAPLPLARAPFFCSGCPHNVSTQAPDDVLVGAGIGCHSIVVLNQQDRGEVAGITQMGGEGAQWFGMAPFLAREHFVQNVGDGTFHHSASLAIRAAVASGVNITFKLLYNDGIAMTGGQEVPGQLSPAEITRLLEAEGVVRTVITTEDPGRYRRVPLAANAEVRDRAELAEVQRRLAAVEGVTVLLHDQRCAAENRRKRKRGELPEPAERVHINERVCEGCGDCGRKSSCLSVQPVETEWGRKTQIDQGSCNKDYSCLEGDCPSFLTVVPGKAGRKARPPVPIALPDPEPRVDARDFTIRMAGIGGTGVVTVAQILGVAAMTEGRHVWGVDQTGLSQKGGQVTSDLRIAQQPIAGSNRPGGACVDLLLGFDLLGAATPEVLRSLDPERALAVLSTSEVATGEMVVDTATAWPGSEPLLDRVSARTRPGENLELDAQGLCERLFGEVMPANLLLVGVAYQHGALPLAAASIRRAIEINDVEVELNLLAFDWGRALAIEPELAERAMPAPAPPRRAPLPGELAAEVAAVGGAELVAAVGERAADLAGYQDLAYAREYVRFVADVRRREAELAPGREEIALAVARNLHKLMAYKDEYEVARLLLDAGERAAVEARFGPDAEVSWNLHPPLLRSLGMKRKLRLGRRFEPALRGLRAARRLRRSGLDPFGHSRVRRVERSLIGEYREAVERGLGLLSPGTAAGLLELCDLPREIRGYEGLKLASATEYREAAAAVLSRLESESRRGASAPG